MKTITHTNSKKTAKLQNAEEVEYVDLTDSIQEEMFTISENPFWGKDSHFLDPSAEFKENMTFLQIGGRNALERQGLTTISSTPKTGKSLSVYAMLTPTVTGETFSNVVQIGEKAKRVIIFDTEMTDNDLVRRSKFLYVNDKTKKNIGIYPLLSTPKTERMNIIERVIDEYNPDIVVIDTVARLINDYNSSSEANRLGDFLTKLMRNRSVIAVIHLTKGTEKMKGHVGSVLEELAMENYTVCRHNEVIELKVKNARNSDTSNAESIYFQIHAGKICECDSDEIDKEKAETRNITDLFNEIFDEYDNKPLKRTQLEKMIMEKRNVRRSTSNEIINKAIELGIITKQGDKHFSPYVLCLDEAA